ncbi:MAG: hypothetical protein U5R46_09175 [Gammaproteobacteria bacterium]|nr:hypothetical protein [Gammaproteobacteria bacterium]
MILYISVATAGYALMLIGFSRGPLYTNPHLVGVLVNLVGASIPFILFAAAGMRLGGADDVKGILWSLVGGAGITTFTLAMARIFSVGGNLGFVTPLVYGGSLVLVTIVSALFFRERIGSLQLFGLVLVVVGIGCIVLARYQAFASAE